MDRQIIPQAKVELLFLGLEHGVESVRASGGPLTPFVIIERNGKREIARFLADQLEEALDKAATYVRSVPLAGADICVLVYDGYMNTSEGKWDTIYAEALDSTGQITIVGQRYRPRTGQAEFDTIGNPALLPGAHGRL